jgi:hypothetical protein
MLDRVPSNGRNMKDVTYIAAFPKSGITFLNYMLFHVLFDAPEQLDRIDSDFIFDLHENLSRVPPPGETPRYVKIHSSFGLQLPLLTRAARAVYLIRDPIDVMMSIWDFKHLTDQDALLGATSAERNAKLEFFCRRWLATGGLEYPFTGSWVQNVRSWLGQSTVPLVVVRYEELKREPIEQLQRILTFLGRTAPSERIRSAVEAGSVENMRKQESIEVTNRVSGAFYRPALEKGYAHGYRFVGRLNQDSYERVLNPAARRQADEIFGPVLRWAHERTE